MVAECISWSDIHVYFIVWIFIKCGWATNWSKLPCHHVRAVSILRSLRLWSQAYHNHHHHLPLNPEGRWSTTDDFTTSFLHFSLFSTWTGTWWTPGLSIPWCCLSTSSSVCLVFFPLLLCLAKWFWPDLMNWRHVHTTAVGVSLQWSGGLRETSCLLNLCTDFLVGNMVFVWDTKYLAVAPHFHGFFWPLLWRSMMHKHTGRWTWQGSASVVSWNCEKYTYHFKLVLTLSMLLLSVLAWRLSQAFFVCFFFFFF